MKSLSSVGFLGGGRIVRCLVGGWARADKLPDRLLVTEPDRSALEKLKTLCAPIHEASAAEVARTELLVLALHPPALLEAVDDLAGTVGPETIVLSLAPKVTIAKLASVLGTSRLARMIPNVASFIGAGYNPITFGPGLPDSQRELLRSAVRPWGKAPEVSEEKLEAYAIVSAMGPTYFWPQIQALKEVATSIGLSPKEAEDAIALTLEGAVRALFESGLKPGEVMDLIPLKPLAEEMAKGAEAMRDRLPALYQKIKP